MLIRSKMLIAMQVLLAPCETKLLNNTDIEYNFLIKLTINDEIELYIRIDNRAMYISKKLCTMSFRL